MGSVKDMRDRYPAVNNQGRDFHMGFDSNKRYSYFIVEEGADLHTIYMKGAP